MPAFWIAGIADLHSASFVVANTNDSGSGSLRQAIINVNSNSGPSTVTFQIAGTGPFTISPLSTYPPINQPVTIDGTSQPGYTNKPLIQINGAGIGANGDGLLVSAGGNGSIIQGLAIYDCVRDGIRISGATSNVIRGCYLGTDATGTNAHGNAEAGVYLFRSFYNIVGGTNATDRNVISGGNLFGVCIDDSTPPAIGTGNIIQGNYIGTTAAGTNSLGNANAGVYIISAPGNLIGGTGPGAGNVISGNTSSGVLLIGAASVTNIIAGNLIGTDVTGKYSVANGGDGITLYGASTNLVGGTGGQSRNVVSGNISHGIYIVSAGTTNAGANLVQGNYIGTDITGRQAIPNLTNGVAIVGAYGNVIGGTNVAARNLISGNNQNGLAIGGAGASNNVISGNYIGLDASGTNAIPNTYGGLSISGAGGNVIGGTNTGNGNVISGNLQNGIFLPAGGTSNSVQGNFIGTDASGSLAISNNAVGIWIETPGNLIGGTLAKARNVISGNFQHGIYLVSTASNNVIQGNFIGTDASGAVALPNGPTLLYSGIYINGSPANTVGGAVPGAGNVISGNGYNGITLNALGSTGNVIQGNDIGTDATGTKALGNNSGGIYIFSASTNYIGGTNAGAGNLISGNNADGIYVSAAYGTVIQGNYIGTKADGVSALGNLWHNIEFLNNASYNLVGGNYPGADNRIAYTRTAQYDGIRVRDGSAGNRIYRNSIFSNGAGSPQGLGITVGNVGVTTNGLPVLSSAMSGVSTIVNGTLASTPSTTFLLQLYANLVTNVSGYGEGLTWLGSTNIVTDATGNTSFTVRLATNVPPGQFIAATVTDSTNNTSEFSADILVQRPPSVSLVSSNYLAIVTTNYNSGLRTNPVTHVITTNSPSTIVSTNYLKRFYLSWPTNPPGFSVVQATSLTPVAVWVTLTNQPAVFTNQYRLLLPITNRGNGFFRLQIP